MAKLEGVKTLDMVNGEITKVAYCGTEYERVEGEAQKGDIVLVKEAWGAQNVGEFFVVTYTRSGTFDQIVGMDGNTCEASSYKHCLKIFRKVAASTNPTVEERVAKAEGEIESLKTDVAALKGEAEYERIAKSEAQVGDYVKFIETDDEDITIGKLYEIEAIDCDGDPVFTDDIDQENYAQSDDTYEVYRKVSASSVEAEPKPERLKVGDYAKVVDVSNGVSKRGDIVRIIEDDKSAAPFLSEHLNGNSAGWFHEYELVRATDEEVTEAKRAAELAKFKEGAKVRLKSGGEKYPLNGFENGKIYEVANINFNHRLGRRIAIEGGDSREVYGFATPDQLEILSEEEAAELKKWAEIGREVGEYKKGDFVKLTLRSGGIFFGEITEHIVGNTYGFKHLHAEYGTTSEYSRDLTLITPVEARFDL
ncbi:hypothetical protein ES963_16375 [Bacillus subtilis]|uniref:hypothetical protein n=1 Tax=Bacillus subtilis TaxID=1423 RepID=UPI00100A111A|nr:hypothetical protein [Bacillus subtilis]QAV89588.1 hypothetical protein ES963_16375 [Bacillus subtilis]